MVSLLFFSQLVLCALIWLFAILHLTWAKRVVTAPASPALRVGRPQAWVPAGAGWQGVGGRGWAGLREKWLYFSYTL